MQNKLHFIILEIFKIKFIFARYLQDSIFFHLKYHIYLKYLFKLIKKNFLQWNTLDWNLLTFVNICQHMSTNVNICQHMLTYVHICSHMLTYDNIC